jgi:hypothetical protein
MQAKPMLKLVHKYAHIWAHVFYTSGILALPKMGWLILNHSLSVIWLFIDYVTQIGENGGGGEGVRGREYKWMAPKCIFPDSSKGCGVR